MAPVGSAVRAGTARGVAESKGDGGAEITLDGIAAGTGVGDGCSTGVRGAGAGVDGSGAVGGVAVAVGVALWAGVG
jgi:hypothetical protein